MAQKSSENPHPDLVYGQIVKENEGSKIVSITYRIKCDAERFKQLELKISYPLGKIEFDYSAYPVSICPQDSWV